MYSMSSMPTATSVVSTYTAFAASAMLARSVVREVQSMTSQLVPKFIRDEITSKMRFLFDKPSSEMTLVIDQEFNGPVKNEVYEASQLYLRDKISPSNTTLKVTKAEGDKDLSVTAENGEEIIDFYQGVRLRWVLECTESQRTKFNVDNGSGNSNKVEHRSFHLSFLKIHMEAVLGSYLPHILEFAKSRRKLKRVVKLSSLGGGGWGVNLNHPSTFDTLAMDPALKKAIMDDLDRFVKRKDYYRRVGKAWKRGYLLYGPPGTGKSSLIAAMANYLKFSVYDLDLTSIRNNTTLKSLLISTRNRSILVIEDIDCGVELQNRESGLDPDDEFGEVEDYTQGLLNFIDGLWSSFGDQRIIVFTTNYKEKIDPALLRPGRMDMHIHMSYLTPSAFRILAFNYLGIDSHPLFTQIEHLLTELEVTPATVAGELMINNDDLDACLESLRQHLQNKKSEVCNPDPKGQNKSIEKTEEIQGTVQHDPKLKGSKRKVSISARKSKQAKLCHGDMSAAAAATTLNVEGCPECLS